MKFFSFINYPLISLTLLCSLLPDPCRGDDEGSPFALPAEYVEVRVPIEGGHLACRRRKASGPSIVLIPGTFSDARVYTRMVENLDPQFDIVLFENRGLGGSWPPPAESSIEQCARDVVTLADALKIESFYVGGHSLGGMISIELAKQIPNRLYGVISIEGWTNAKAAADAFQGDMKSTQSPAQVELLKNYRTEVLERWTPEQIKMFGSIWRKWDGSETLSQTKIRVLELYGDRNRPVPSRDALGLPKRREIQLVWFAGASHSLLIERPNEVASTINSFIHGLEDSRKSPDK
ncbi:MAG: alpha/beta hydrolase [Planctomycetaceae bacterium]|nr:alpha/beta hydrolase [Planctomycetaceae bacterium]